jgi:hypothetical protein
VTADYVALILTHGRPDRVFTLDALKRSGYTGPWLLVVDDEDEQLGEYESIFGRERVVVFSKRDIAEQFDQGDNFADRRCIVYARNAAYDIAKEHGYRYFIQLDDDYLAFRYRFDERMRWANRQDDSTLIRDLDAVWGLMFDYFEQAPAFSSIAMSQGGDYMGGAIGQEQIGTKRKAMNSFFCDTERRVWFPGKLNEDVTVYSALQRRGTIFLSLLQVWLDQAYTQSNFGGMTDIYRGQGTYVKSFYTVMNCPSAVKVYLMPSAHARLHHRVSYNACAPKILRPVVEPAVG